MLGGGWPLVFAATTFLTLFGAISAVAGWWDIGPPRGWIVEYQSLLGGILALIGAAATVWYLRRQVQQASEAAARARQIDIAALNRPLIDRLDDLVDGSNVALAILMASGIAPRLEGPFIREAVEAHEGVRLGTELAMINALMTARRSAGVSMRKIEGLSGALPQSSGNLRQEIRTAIPLLSLERQTATRLGVLLRVGWSPLELASMTGEELEALRESLS